MNAMTLALESHHRLETYRSLHLNGGLLDFSSNDYLGLSRCPKIRAKLIEELEAGCPLGATGSRLLSGQTKYHERVEYFLAETFGVPSALLFSSGFMANLGVLSTFGSLGATFFSDEFNHASLVDGMRSSKVEKRIFNHNDLNHLEKLLTESSSDFKVIVTESVFSMDGDLAPLAGIAELGESHNAWLVVDEAHATGVFGPHGLGRLEEIALERLVSIHTGGKALGGQGAFVLSGRDFRELLVNRARSFIFSTALSPLSALQIEYAITEILSNPSRGQALLHAAEAWRQNFPIELDTLQSKSQIVPVIIGTNKRTLKVAVCLQEHGFDVRAIRSPTVPKGAERLRITVKSYHQPQDLQIFLKFLEEATA